MSRVTPKVAWCLPYEYTNCNNNLYRHCCVLTESVRYGEKCPFYRSVEDTTIEDLRKFHAWKLRDDKTFRKEDFRGPDE